MNLLLLSIKPKYAEKILNGEKIFELRRLFTKKEVKKVIIYESAPISRVVGEFKIEKVLYEPLDKLRNDTRNYSCVDKKFFDKYFEGKEYGYAIKIKHPKRYKESKFITEYGTKTPPQSYYFI